MSPEPSAEMQAVFSMAGISKSGPQYKDKILPADDNFLKIVAVGGSYLEEVRVLFEGRYSPTWPDGTKHSKCVYAHTREECEAKLKVMIQQMNAERKAIQDRLRGIVSPDKLTKKQRQIWEYLRLHPDETDYSEIARGAKVNRHTVAKHYGMVREMLGFQ